MSISSKEARKTKYWIELLTKTDYLSMNDKHTQTLLNNNIDEIVKLLTSIVKSSQGK